MKKKIISLILLTACLAALLSSSMALAASYPYTAIAGKDGANLREQADINSKILIIIHPNELVTVTGKRGDWYAVSHLGKRGYVHQNKISFFSNMVFDGDEAMIRQVNQRAFQSAVVFVFLLLFIALMILALISFGSYLYSLVSSIF